MHLVILTTQIMNEPKTLLEPTALDSMLASSEIEGCLAEHEPHTHSLVSIQYGSCGHVGEVRIIAFLLAARLRFVDIV